MKGLWHVLRHVYWHVLWHVYWHVVRHVFRHGVLHLLILNDHGKVRRSHYRAVIVPKALKHFVFPSKLCPRGVASFPLVKIDCSTMGARAATTDDAPRSGQTPSPARSDTPEFYPEIREAEELERMTLAELEQRQQMAAACAASPEAAPSGATGASAPALAPRSDSSESSSSTSSFEMSDGEAREALAAAAAERAMGARTIALVPTAVSDGEEDGEEDWGGWKVPKRSAFQAFCGLQQQIYRENGQESVYQLHMERNEPAPLAHGIYGSVDFLNELSRLGEPGYLAGMAAGRTDVIPLPPKDCEEEVVGVPPGYHSYMSPCYSHGLLYFGKPKVGDPPFMEHDDYLNLPFRRMDQAVLTTELEDHHAQILSQLTQAASAVDFGCNLKVITLVVNQLGESLTSNKSVHPKLLPMSYHLQQGHTFALYLLGLVNLYQENHEKYDIGHAERVTSETTPMWIQRCVWEIIGNVIKDEAKEHYSLEEYRASSKAARSKAAARPPDGGSDSDSSSSGGLSVLRSSYENLGWSFVESRRSPRKSRGPITGTSTLCRGSRWEVRSLHRFHRWRSLRRHLSRHSGFLPDLRRRSLERATSRPGGCWILQKLVCPLLRVLCLQRRKADCPFRQGARGPHGGFHPIQSLHRSLPV